MSSPEGLPGFLGLKEPLESTERTIAREKNVVESIPTTAAVEYLQITGDPIVIENRDGTLYVNGNGESQRNYWKIFGYAVLGAGTLIVAGWSFKKFVKGRSDITRGEKKALGRIDKLCRELPEGGKTSLDEEDIQVSITARTIKSLMVSLIARADRREKRRRGLE